MSKLQKNRFQILPIKKEGLYFMAVENDGYSAFWVLDSRFASLDKGGT
jgi:hypothetical protein